MKKYFLFFLASFMMLSYFNGFSQKNCIVAWYPLNGNAADISGNGNDGTLTGTTATTDHLGNAGGALYFNGTSDKITLPSDFDFPERTICLWLKADNFSSNGQWAYSSDHATIVYGQTQLYVQNESGINKICFGIGANYYKYSNAITGTWYHAAISVHAAYLKFYINGVMVDSCANNSFTHSSDGDVVAKIGTTRKNDRYFNGSIDDARIYDCGLSDDEIYQIYSGTENCLYAWYPLDGNGTDASGNGYNGTLSGTTATSGHDGISNTALYFNGTSDKVTLPTDFDFPERTISLWLKADNFSSNGQWAYTSDHATIVYGQTQLYVQNESGINKICFGIGANYYKYSNALTGTWYHAAISVHAAYLKFYINGVMVDSCANNSFTHSSDGDAVAKIGTTRKNDRFFSGSIDEVRIYDCGLSDNEIYDQYVSVKESFNPLQSFLMYPNPSQNELTVEYSNSKNYNSTSILIYDISGHLLANTPVNSQKTTIDISGLAKGIYVLKLMNSEGISVKKFIKE